MTIRYILISTIILFLMLSHVGRISAAPQPTPTPTPVPIVQYDLAFPGILPDHPLFKVKVLRDKIKLAITQNPSQKMSMHLLLADKGILATAMLLEKGNVTLANQTALKAEHNMTMITTYLPRAGLHKDSALLAKIKTASLKHQEVLGVLINRLPPDQQETLKTVHEFSVRNLQSIEQFEKESL